MKGFCGVWIIPGDVACDVLATVVGWEAVESWFAETNQCQKQGRIGKICWIQYFYVLSFEIQLLSAGFVVFLFSFSFVLVVGTCCWWWCGILRLVRGIA